MIYNALCNFGILGCLGTRGHVSWMSNKLEMYCVFMDVSVSHKCAQLESFSDGHTL